MRNFSSPAWVQGLPSDHTLHMGRPSFACVGPGAAARILYRVRPSLTCVGQQSVMWHFSLEPVDIAVEPAVESAMHGVKGGQHAAEAGQVIDVRRAVCPAAQVTGSLVYRAAASKLYPVISCYADPALDRLTHSPYYSAVLDHLKPQPTSCALQGAPLAAASGPLQQQEALTCVHC